MRVHEAAARSDPLAALPGQAALGAPCAGPRRGRARRIAGVVGVIGAGIRTGRRRAGAAGPRPRQALPATGRGRTAALDGVSFALRRGSTLGIVGESGSGKSTAADVVLGFTEPDAGEVLLDGLAWSTAPERERRARRNRIQSISQDPLGSFDPRADVRSILSEALEAIGVPRSERRDRAVELLERVDLGAEHLARNPLELSGGQRQRVAISRALATDPEVLVCDEAVSALDVSIQAQVLDLLAELQRSTGISLLFISHDLGVIRHVADEVLVMRRGRVVEAGRTQAVFEHPQHDYTRRLVDAIPKLRFSPPTPTHTTTPTPHESISPS
ncbi:ABC transporter ATP-binding protein [Leucobacter sp. UCD-THU]|uniref:ABC transporter ATP-binding protein n=1 Tax=Leucobacter sp. UCD-THU TaxID=1292023 RepID=UPI0027962192|nr:ATP-binding cassette domain-containing protein [Leucobacter sp. UCD-THU]